MGDTTQENSALKKRGLHEKTKLRVQGKMVGYQEALSMLDPQFHTSASKLVGKTTSDAAHSGSELSAHGTGNAHESTGSS